MSNDLEYILNEKNKRITKDFIENTLKKHANIDIKIHNIDHFQRAMIHLSYLERNEKFYANNKTKAYQIQSTEIEPIHPENIKNTIPLQEESYERLEFLGDAVLHNILAEYLFKRYDKEDEGFMTKLRTKIENGDTLSILSQIIGLSEYVVISRYVELNGGRQSNKSLLEDAFEAFIGALYLEAGYEICNKFVTRLIEKEIDLAQMLHTVTNFKEKLLQFFHLKKYQDPVYGTLDISGPENAKKYTIYVKCRKTPQDEGEIVGIGVSSSKKDGEQAAAKACLIKFNVYKEEGEEEYEEVEEMSEDDGNIKNVISDDEVEEMSEDENTKKVIDDKIKEISNEETKTFSCPSCKNIFVDMNKYVKHISTMSCEKKNENLPSFMIN
ncbi:ribonuclease III [Indivirus ILV1]|uniref:Ribonuclease III n=1 Tax=Indivirus ILV1 TaxID=1977633 RepID=A0A1V0SDK0_9VIRU|nr:ribonuclease III [Indivirus ILV1]